MQLRRSAARINASLESTSPMGVREYDSTERPESPLPNGPDTPPLEASLRQQMRENDTYFDEVLARLRPKGANILQLKHQMKATDAYFEETLNRLRPKQKSTNLPVFYKPSNPPVLSQHESEMEKHRRPWWRKVLAALF
jgi:hypothetical protein